MKSNKRSLFFNNETFIWIDFCWCGHDKDSHCGSKQCNIDNCNCLEFSP